MLRPYSYSFGSFPKNAQSPDSSSKGTPVMQPEIPPLIDEHGDQQRRLAIASDALSRFKAVEFDCGHFDWSKNSIFKYVLIEIGSPAVNQSKQIVRGMTSADYHAESAEPTLRQIDVAGLTHRVLGGGRIRYATSTKTLTVYGYSMGYPWPNGEYKNELVAQIIKTSFPHLNVEWSNEECSKLMATRVSTLPSQAPVTMGFGSSTWANEPPTEAERAKVRAERTLMRAILNNDVSAFNSVLSSHSDIIDINFESSGKMTPLHTAMAHGRVDMVSSLIEKRANVHALNSIGFTPLMSAASKGHEVCVQLALKAGASKSVKSVRGESALDLASSNNFHNIVNLLK